MKQESANIREDKDDTAIKMDETNTNENIDNETKSHMMTKREEEKNETPDECNNITADIVVSDASIQPAQEKKVISKKENATEVDNKTHPVEATSGNQSKHCFGKSLDSRDIWQSYSFEIKGGFSCTKAKA